MIQQWLQHMQLTPKQTNFSYWPAPLLLRYLSYLSLRNEEPGHAVDKVMLTVAIGTAIAALHQMNIPPIALEKALNPSPQTLLQKERPITYQAQISEQLSVVFHYFTNQVVKSTLLLNQWADEHHIRLTVAQSDYQYQFESFWLIAIDSSQTEILIWDHFGEIAIDIHLDNRVEADSLWLILLPLNDKRIGDIQWLNCKQDIKYVSPVFLPTHWHSADDEQHEKLQQVIQQLLQWPEVIAWCHNCNSST
jgi:hypothetical protein